MAEVRLVALSKRFGEVAAVKHVDLHVSQGEFVVLVGPSGCGKTTTLRMVAGLETPTEGRVYIGDRDVTLVHPRERGVAMVFQDYALYPHMTVEDNLSFGLRNLKYPKHEIQMRVGQAAEMLRIVPLLSRKPRELSGGQRQRVALGRAITRQPQVFLFDEPLSNLDAQLRMMMRVELAELHARLATTVLYVTHDQVEAMTLGQRIVVMSGGEVQQVGTPTELYDRPANAFVAEFLGSPPINLLPIRISSADGIATLGEAVRIPLAYANGWRSVPPTGTDLLLGLRPEDIRIVADAKTDHAWPKFSVYPKVVEMLGATNLIYFDLGGALIKASLGPDVRCQVGEPVEIEFNLAHAHIFDRATGQRVTEHELS